MSNKKITAFPYNDNPTLSDAFPIVNSGETKQMTLSGLTAFVDSIINVNHYAGVLATEASYSNLFGYNVGNASALTSIGTNNIIIGTNITLPNARANSLNIGGVLFGSGTYSTIAGNPSTGATAGGKIGINIVTPTANLHIAASTTASALMRLEVGSAPSAPNNGDIWLEDSSLTGLKIFLSGVTRTITIS